MKLLDLGEDVWVPYLIGALPSDVTSLIARPFLNGLPEAIFQQDNACLHTARVAPDFLRHFQTLPCRPYSLDLSPVEHVWDQLKRQMLSCHSVHSF
ncbi:uncharacterized protein TNCV_1514521 [Trichonephila clavipes]|nr:uncharacterized protein TNCV_1514521 [Trichonephila clavipes]